MLFLLLRHRSDFSPIGHHPVSLASMSPPDLSGPASPMNTAQEGRSRIAR